MSSTNQKEYSRRYYEKKKQDPEWVAKHLRLYREWCASQPGIHARRNKQYRQQKPERFAVYEIRKRYKVSLIEAAQLFERKKHGCEVCGSKIKPSIDHNHETGFVRGILCDGCNLAVGHSNESPATLRALADYLEAHCVD